MQRWAVQLLYEYTGGMIRHIRDRELPGEPKGKGDSESKELWVMVIYGILNSYCTVHIYLTWTDIKKKKW